MKITVEAFENLLRELNQIDIEVEFHGPKMMFCRPFINPEDDKLHLLPSVNYEPTKKDLKALKKGMMVKIPDRRDCF